MQSDLPRIRRIVEDLAPAVDCPVVAGYCPMRSTEIDPERSFGMSKHQRLFTKSSGLPSQEGYWRIIALYRRGRGSGPSSALWRIAEGGASSMGVADKAQYGAKA
ncbi:hypothetical protein [Burkholderia ubonensis]|uniref:hypothetical protein n=1 Tax=Burkholderia ubonensis TaxID=101571 RepID=UPI00105420DF|nr:hypothetical protein [Burkholderia ubonensis]